MDKMPKLLATFFLLLAIFLEVAGTTSMKMSDGFTYLLPSIFIFVFYFLSFVFFSFSLHRIDLSLAYAIWSGLGILLLAIIGAVFFAEPLTLAKSISLGFIIVGAIGLQLV